MSNNPAIGVIFGVSLTTDQLTTDELVILVNTLGFEGYIYKNLPFYEKIKQLFTEGDTMHKDVKESIIILAGRRLQE